MVKPAEHWRRDDFSFSGRGRSAVRGALGDPLVRAALVEEGHVLASKPGQMLVVEHENVIEHLAPERARESFRDRVHVGRPDRRLDDANARPFGGAVEGRAEFVVAIPDQKLRRAAVHRGVSDLLGGPILGGVACDGDVDDAAGAEVDDEEEEDWAEEQIATLDEVARPDVPGP
jgi:hypothetical protein